MMFIFNIMELEFQFLDKCYNNHINKLKRNNREYILGDRDNINHEKIKNRKIKNKTQESKKLS